MGRGRAPPTLKTWNDCRERGIMKGEYFVYGLAAMQCGAGITFACEGKYAKAAFWGLLCCANLVFTRF